MQIKYYVIVILLFEYIKPVLGFVSIVTYIPFVCFVNWVQTLSIYIVEK